jgi:superfamily II DNA/RNA helicase
MHVHMHFDCNVMCRGGGLAEHVFYNEVQKLLADKRFVMVFCNSVDSCRFVGHFLNERGVPTIDLHGGLSPAFRQRVRVG